MANEENLRPSEYKLSQEEGKRGGIASGEARRRKRTFQETAKWILDIGIQSGKLFDTEDVEGLAEMRGQNISVAEAIMLAQIQRAMKGDTRAAEFVRDSSGQRPADKSNILLDMPVLFEGEDKLE